MVKDSEINFSRLPVLGHLFRLRPGGIILNFLSLFCRYVRKSDIFERQHRAEGKKDKRTM